MVVVFPDHARGLGPGDDAAELAPFMREVGLGRECRTLRAAAVFGSPVAQAQVNVPHRLNGLLIRTGTLRARLHVRLSRRCLTKLRSARARPRVTRPIFSRNVPRSTYLHRILDSLVGMARDRARRCRRRRPPTSAPHPSFQRPVIVSLPPPVHARSVQAMQYSDTVSRAPGDRCRRERTPAGAGGTGARLEVPNPLGRVRCASVLARILAFVPFTAA